MADSDAIEALLAEDRTFPPPPDFAPARSSTTRPLHDEAAKDREAFWERQAEALDWFDKWHTVCEWDLPFAKWFIGGTLNVSYNALDRHVAAGKGDKVAFHWEGEPGDTRTITYAEMLDEVERFANVLKNLGVQARRPRRTSTCRWCPSCLSPCWRARASAPRTRSCSAASRPKRCATASTTPRRRCSSPPTAATAAAPPAGSRSTPTSRCKETPTIEHVVVVRRTGQDVEWTEGRDHWWHDLMDDPSLDAHCEPEHMDSEDLLYLLYTSGTTAKPKGIMHTTGGYLTQVAFTHKYVFDLHADEDIYWCAADIGWVTGPQLHRLRPAHQRRDVGDVRGHARHAGQGPVVGHHRALPRVDPVLRAHRDPHVHEVGRRSTRASTTCRSLRLLGSVGEPINPEAWVWYWNTIGGGRCPVVDTWWQTETGGIMISPLPGLTTLKPGSATFPLPGISAELVDDAGKPVPRGGGYLTLTEPWPAMLRGIWGDPERYKETYWSRFEGRYFAGDGAKTDDDGYLWLLGRVDDVMNVSGHRVSTTEVESALVDHPSVAEAAVVGANDATTGQAIIAFVTLRRGNLGDEAHGQMLRDHVATKIGPIAKPKTIVFTDDLPKTRSGKIMRRLLRDVAEGPRPRRHDHARRPGGRRRDRQARRDLADRGVSPQSHAEQLVVARRRGRAGSRRDVRPRRRVVRRRRSPALHRRAAPRLAARSSTRAVTIRSSKKSASCCTCSTARCRSCCSRRGRCACRPRPSAGSSATTCAGTC